jgi:hypothetical protein
MCGRRIQHGMWRPHFVVLPRDPLQHVPFLPGGWRVSPPSAQPEARSDSSVGTTREARSRIIITEPALSHSNCWPPPSLELELGVLRVAHAVQEPFHRLHHGRGAAAQDGHAWPGRRQVGLDDILQQQLRYPGSRASMCVCVCVCVVEMEQQLAGITNRQPFPMQNPPQILALCIPQRPPTCVMYPDPPLQPFAGGLSRM